MLNSRAAINAKAMLVAAKAHTTAMADEGYRNGWASGHGYHERYHAALAAERQALSAYRSALASKANRPT